MRLTRYNANGADGARAAARHPSAPRLGPGHLLVIGVVLALIAKLLITRIQALGSIGAFGAVLADAVFIVVLLGPALVWPRSAAGRAWLAVSAFVVSFVMAGVVVYARYFGEVVTPLALSAAGQLGETGGSVVELLELRDILYFIDLPAWFWLLWRARPAEFSLPRRGTERLLAGAAWVAAVAVFALQVHGITQQEGLLASRTVSWQRGVFAYQVASVLPQPEARIAGGVDVRDPASVSAAIERLKGASGGERRFGVDSGVAEGASVILVQVEAMQEVVIGLEIDGREITPALNDLAERSYFFDDGYCQIGGGNTADAEFVSMTSIYPPQNLAASEAWEDKVVPSLPRILRERGYRSVTFHSNDASFWNRRQMYAGLGFDAYYDDDFFGEEDVIGYGASDEVLFRRGLSELLAMRDAGQPFLAQFVTVTTHHPFKPLPAEKNPYRPPAPYAGTVVGDYLSHMEYADRAVGGFIEDLKASGLYDECVLIVYGDHYGLRDINPQGQEKEAVETLYGGRAYGQIDRAHVPLFIHLPGQTEGTVVGTGTGFIDIAPTVLDLLGVPAETPLFGRSLFAEAPVVIGMRRALSVGSYIGADTFVLPATPDRGALAIPLDDPLVRREPTPTELEGLAIAEQLMLLSDAYATALPPRPDFEPDPEVVIPVERK